VISFDNITIHMESTNFLKPNQITLIMLGSLFWKKSIDYFPEITLTIFGSLFWKKIIVLFPWTSINLVLFQLSYGWSLMRLLTVFSFYLQILTDYNFWKLDSFIFSPVLIQQIVVLLKCSKTNTSVEIIVIFWHHLISCRSKIH
jgi:hypothetical protein